MAVNQAELGFERCVTRGAPTSVPAAVVTWLASAPAGEARELNGTTVSAQRFALERSCTRTGGHHPGVSATPRFASGARSPVHHPRASYAATSLCFWRCAPPLRFGARSPEEHLRHAVEPARVDRLELDDASARGTRTIRSARTPPSARTRRRARRRSRPRRSGSQHAVEGGGRAARWMWPRIVNSPTRSRMRFSISSASRCRCRRGARGRTGRPRPTHGHRALLGDRALGHDDDRGEPALLVAALRSSPHPLDVNGSFGHEDLGRPACDAGVGSQSNPRAAHHLAHDHPIVRLGRRVQAIDGVRGDLNGRVKPEGDLGGRESLSIVLGTPTTLTPSADSLWRHRACPPRR